MLARRTQNCRYKVTAGAPTAAEAAPGRGGCTRTMKRRSNLRRALVHSGGRGTCGRNRGKGDESCKHFLSFLNHDVSSALTPCCDCLCCARAFRGSVSHSKETGALRVIVIFLDPVAPLASHRQHVRRKMD